MTEQPLEGLFVLLLNTFYVLTFELWRVFPKFPDACDLFKLHVSDVTRIFTLKHPNNLLLCLWPHRSESLPGFPTAAHVVQTAPLYCLCAALCTASRADFDIKSNVLHLDTFIVCGSMKNIKHLWKVQVAQFVFSRISRAAYVSLACLFMCFWFLQKHLHCENLAICRGQLGTIPILNNTITQSRVDLVSEAIYLYKDLWLWFLFQIIHTYFFSLPRADYWKSQPKKFCDYCKCWIADNRPVRWSTIICQWFWNTKNLNYRLLTSLLILMYWCMKFVVILEIFKIWCVGARYMHTKWCLLFYLPVQIRTELSDPAFSSSVT